MTDTNAHKKRKSSGGDSPELRVVEINYNPAPDAEDRLRRLFTILVKHAARDGRFPPRTDPSPEDGSGGGG